MFPNYIAYNLLFADLLHRFVYINDAPYIIFPILIPVLIWQISKYFFKSKFAFIPPIIFLVSPWFWYESLAHSFYVYLFFLTLLMIYGVVLIKFGKKIFGNIIFSLASLVSIYSSSLFLFYVPFLITVLLISKIIDLKQFKYSLIAIIIFCLPIMFLIQSNRSAFKNSINLEIKVFSDPGLINTVNRYQGAAALTGFRPLAKISENKFIFYAEFFVAKYLDQLTPIALFTPQYRLLDYSFCPPILLGFLIPFAYGLYCLLKDPKVRKIIIASTLLVIPSILANTTVALNRLLLFSPAVILIISYGLIELFKQKGQARSKFFLSLTALLILFQVVLTVVDINLKESQRFTAYQGKAYQLVEP